MTDSTHEQPPAPLDFQREQAHRYLERLVGFDLVALVEVEAGRCDDCGSERRRHRYGRFFLCLRCAYRRRDVATRGVA